MNTRSLIIAHKIIVASLCSPEIITKCLNNLRKQKIYIVEFDIRETHDGFFIVSHDNKLLGFPKLMKESTLIELRKYSEEKKCSLMTLDEALSLIPQEFQVNIELKDKVIVVSKFIATIKRFDINRFIISSFYPKNLLRLYNSGIQRRWLLTSISYRRNLLHLLYALRPIRTAIKYKATGIAPFYRLVTPELIRKAHDKDLTVAAWTVNDKKIAELLQQNNADWIISDIT